MAMDDSIIYSTIPLYDVFVYGGSQKPLTCYLCNFGDMVEAKFEAESTLEMEGHLRAHLNKGDILPSEIFEEISRNSHYHYRPKKQ
jgi:hypothetical protein